MPEIQSVENATRDGEDGFIIEWQFIGFSESAARFRAVMMTAMRFPSTITTSKVVGVREFGDRDYNVRVFVPTEGFLSAGIQNPVEWVQEQFNERFMGDR